MIDYKSFNLMTTMPANLLEDDNVRACAKALDIEIGQLADILKETLIISRIDELSEEVIDSLAWQWHVDYYDNSLPLDNKRKLVRQSIEVHRRKGTTWAVEQVVNAILGTSYVSEWYDYDGEPYHFKVINTKNTVGETSVKKILKAIESAKNVRSHLDEIRTVITDEDEYKAYTGIAHVKRGVEQFSVGYDSEQEDVPEYDFTTSGVHCRTGTLTIGSIIEGVVKDDFYASEVKIISGTKWIDTEYPIFPPTPHEIHITSTGYCYDGICRTTSGIKIIDMTADLSPKYADGATVATNVYIGAATTVHKKYHTERTD